MKSKVTAIYITFGGIVLSIALIMVCYFLKFEANDILMNIGYALFSASSITIFISLVEYQSLKREKTQHFVQQCNKFQKLITGINYLYIGEHEYATVQYMQFKPFYSENTEESISFIKSLKDKDPEFKRCTLDGYRFELEMYGKELDNKISEAIQSYMSINCFDVDTMQLLGQDISFLIHKKNKTLFKDAYTYIESLLDALLKFNGFFRWFLSGKRTQIKDVLQRLDKANSLFFECVEEQNGITIYANANYCLLVMIDKIVNLISKDKIHKREKQPFGFVSKSLVNNCSSTSGDTKA